jgi:hypothetical protein
MLYLADEPEESPPEKPPWWRIEDWPKERKVIALNAVTVGTIAAMGFVGWDYGSHSFRTANEGWFDPDTNYGGADKLGHVFTCYALASVYNRIYRDWGYTDNDAILLGSASSWLTMSVIEIGDGFSKSEGYCWQDEVMNTVGAGMAYLRHRFPEVRERVDFRWEWSPPRLAQRRTLRHPHGLLRPEVPIGLQNGRLAQNGQPRPESVELQVGYYTRGYVSGDDDYFNGRHRYSYVGLGLNVSYLLERLTGHRAWGIFDYYQMPYTIFRRGGNASDAAAGPGGPVPVSIRASPGRAAHGDPDETRYGEIPREMLASGDWIVPHLNGLRYFEKPPLGYWLNAVAISLFGENAFAVRLPSALAAGLTALLLFLWVRRFPGDAAVPWLAAVVFLLSFEVLAIGVFSTLDSLLSLFVTGAIVSLYFAYEQQQRRPKAILLILAGVACGLAFLAKGFLALAVPVVVIVPFALWQGRLRVCLRTAWAPLAVACLVALPWALAIHRREPDFWRYFFWVEHVERFTSPAGGQHPAPFWFYIPILLGGAMPWTVLMGPIIQGVRHADRRQPMMRLALCWFALPCCCSPPRAASSAPTSSRASRPWRS